MPRQKAKSARFSISSYVKSRLHLQSRLVLFAKIDEVCAVRNYCERKGSGVTLSGPGMASTNRINPPNQSVSHPGYQRDCQFALEPSVTKLLDLAVAAGWDQEHVIDAVLVLVASRLKLPAVDGGDVPAQ